jgi:glycine betaine catabolism B
MQESRVVKILSILPVTHDVNQLRLKKPEGYTFNPGQATEVAINKPGLQDERRPFTFTCLNDDPYLEFTIKSYEDHHGVTEQIAKLKPGDELIIHDVWGAIEYKGPGYFIAGGAGITPFIAILRSLKKNNRLEGNTLFFSNKAQKDIILEEELKKMLGDRCVFVLTDEGAPGYEKSYIDENFLRERVDDTSKHFYVCGPPPMIEAINSTLVHLGADVDNVIFEK